MEEVDEDSVSELPSEVIWSEILPRLPAKSLMRFVSVSKPWASLFRNPSFVTAHQNFQQYYYPNKHMMTRVLVGVWDKAVGGLHLLSVLINHQELATSTTTNYNDTTPAVATELLKQPASSHGHINQFGSTIYRVQRTNGLISLHYCYESLQSGERDRAIHVFNPSTRESITIPQPAPPTGRRVWVSHHFGFCPFTNQYKLLQVQRFWDQRPRRTIVLKIFTLPMGSSNSDTSSSWRPLVVDSNDALPLKLLNCNFEVLSVCVHGVIHWVERTGLPPDKNLTRTILVAFDVGDERFRAIILPIDYSTDKKIGNIIEVNGCVGVAYVPRFDMDIMELRILKDYKNQEWAKQTISFPVHWKELGRPLHIQSVRTGGDVVVFRVANTANGIRVYLYNSKTTSFTTSEIILPESMIFQDDMETEILRAFISYDENIVPLDNKIRRFTMSSGTHLYHHRSSSRSYNNEAAEIELTTS